MEGPLAEANPKPRPLLVKLHSTDLKKHLFVRLNKWRQKQEEERPADDANFKFITVTHDMTTTEREDKQGLITKARSMEEAAEGPRKFRVNGPPWNMKIVEINQEGQVVKNH